MNSEAHSMEWLARMHSLMQSRIKQWAASTAEGVSLALK